jgi:DNA-binding NarL/FixJ family response regulator
MIRVVLSEAHSLFRQGLLAVLARDDGVGVLATAETLRGALALEAHFAPDVHLIGATLPPIDGCEAARRIARRRPGAGLVIVAPPRPADREPARAAGDALVAGARGYLAGDAAPEELLRAVRAVAAGDLHLSGPSLLAVVAAMRRLAARQAALTLEQATTVDLVRRGWSNKEIARACGVSESTVKRRLHGAEAAYGVHGRTLVALHGLRPDGASPESADGAGAEPG